MPLPLVKKPFNCIAMDIAGPFPRSNAGYQYVLVIIDYATRFPEAILLKSVTVPKIVEELIKWASGVGIPEEILREEQLLALPRAYFSLNRFPLGCMEPRLHSSD